MSRYRLITLILGLGTLALLGTSSRTMAAPEGTLTFALHYSLPARWLDPAESESIITPMDSESHGRTLQRPVSSSTITVPRPSRVSVTTTANAPKVARV